jgi:hypothetical protein
VDLFKDKISGRLEDVVGPTRVEVIVTAHNGLGASPAAASA